MGESRDALHRVSRVKAEDGLRCPPTGDSRWPLEAGQLPGSPAAEEQAGARAGPGPRLLGCNLKMEKPVPRLSRKRGGRGAWVSAKRRDRLAQGGRVARLPGVGTGSGRRRLNAVTFGFFF